MDSYNSFYITVMFEPPFWVAVCERSTSGKYQVCRIIFGPEPKDNEVYEFLLKNWHCLKFTCPIKSSGYDKSEKNPKRIQREIKRELNITRVGTKAQQAIKQQQEQNKLTRKRISHEQREAEAKLKFDIHKRKSKEKHRGH